MRHKQIIPYRTCTAHQCSAGIDEGVRFHGEGCCGAGGPIRYIEKSGLSVCAQGAEYGRKDSGSGSEDCFYSQTVEGFSSKDSGICKLYGQEFKRYCNTGAGGLSPWIPWTWLRAGSRQPEESGWSIVLTGCQKGKSSKLISFLYQQKRGRRVVELRTEKSLRKD